jgi:SsrA-binding protein
VAASTSTSPRTSRPRARNHPPERDRKLLLHRREIERVVGRMSEKGLTLRPTRIYFKDGRAKVEIALAKGKDRFDKRSRSRSAR